MWCTWITSISSNQTNRYRGNRTAEITEISGALKALAKELNFAVVGLAQLNRSVEGRVNKRPTMADLRDSGSLEQDADLIVFLYREEYYLQTPCSDPNSEDRRIARLAEVRNKLELNIAKQRNGPTGTLEIFLMPPVMPLATWTAAHDRERLHHKSRAVS
jgi:replicative DNA helicase